MRVKFEQLVKVERTLTSIDLHVKCTDSFYASFKDDEGNEILEHEGSVPRFFPGNHYGEYLILKIDPDTGTILNWHANQEDIGDFLEEKFNEG